MPMLSLLNTPISTEYLTDIDLISRLSNYLNLREGGIVSTDNDESFGAYQTTFNILSGNFRQTNSDNVLNYSAKNAFIQAEVANSGNGDSYGNAYTGTKGYCILSVMNGLLGSYLQNSKLLLLSGDLSRLKTIYTEDEISAQYPYLFPKASRSIRIFNGYPYSHEISTSTQLRDIRYSYSLGENSGCGAFKILSVYYGVADMAEELLDMFGLSDCGIVEVDVLPTVQNDMSAATIDDYIGKYLSDDNGIYAPGFPELGNLVLSNFYAQHAEGGSIRAIGKYTHAEGRDNTADVRYSHAEGSHNTAGGMASHAEGMYALAMGRSSHSEGEGVKSNGRASHAEGNNTSAIGEYSHAEGNGTYANGPASHAQGRETKANAAQAFAGGYRSEAIASNSTAIGRFSRTKSGHNNSFAWQGVGDDVFYESNGVGTFNINPVNGLSGIFIGAESLSAIIRNAVTDILRENNLIQ